MGDQDYKNYAIGHHRVYEAAIQMLLEDTKAIVKYIESWPFHVNLYGYGTHDNQIHFIVGWSYSTRKIWQADHTCVSTARCVIIGMVSDRMMMTVSFPRTPKTKHPNPFMIEMNARLLFELMSYHANMEPFEQYIIEKVMTA